MPSQRVTYLNHETLFSLKKTKTTGLPVLREFNDAFITYYIILLHEKN